MTRWAAFAGVTAFVLVALLFLSHLSQQVVEPRVSPGWFDDYVDDGADHLDALNVPPAPTAPDLPPVVLLANVALSQGLFAVLLLGAAWITRVPAVAFGVSAGTTDIAALALGVGAGLALFLVNQAGASVARSLGVGPGERLRGLLAPRSARGWALLLFGVLPMVAGFEELLFRGALIGVMEAGFGVSPWILAVLSSFAFALGHGAQGLAGVAVTGLLGFALAALFVQTGSLLTVVVAHYLVNALEFLVHEGVG